MGCDESLLGMETAGGNCYFLLGFGISHLFILQIVTEPLLSVGEYPGFWDSKFKTKQCSGPIYILHGDGDR